MAEFQHREAAARLEHAAEFLEACHPVREVADAERHRDHIETVVGPGQVLAIGADPVQPAFPFRIVGPCLARFQHGIIDV